MSDPDSGLSASRSPFPGAPSPDDLWNHTAHTAAAEVAPDATPDPDATDPAPGPDTTSPAPHPGHSSANAAIPDTVPAPSHTPATAPNPTPATDPAHPADPAPAPSHPPVPIDTHLDRVRSGLHRLTPDQAQAAARSGALLVDIRYAALRDRDGLIPGALVVERNELEWRLDPQGSHRLPEADRHDREIVVLCNEGYASSLAAASLHALGLYRATDLIGGFQAWRAAGLPVTGPQSP